MTNILQYLHIPSRWMRRSLLAGALLVGSAAAFAQSGMTDEQVLTYVIQEQQAGVRPSQIMTNLMSRGVTKAQLDRVRKKYKDAGKNKTSGKIGEAGETDRSRKNNGEGKEDDYNGSSQQISRERPLTNRPLSQREDVFEYMDSVGNGQEELLEKGKRRVFGRDIFNKKNLTFEPNMNLATPQNYRLGPGDAVFIDIYGASQKTIEGTVSPDGFITIEGFGPVQVSGLSVAQANQRIASQLGARYSSSKIKLTVGQTRTIMVNVMGEVKIPGTYTLSAFATVFHALYMAGGTNELGTLRNIKVYRNGRQITTVDIYDYILNGRLSGNVRLADNDVIVVGPYDCLVNVTGKVKRPMFYEMKRSESVGSVIKYAGGFTGDAYRKSVRLVRKTGRERSIHTIDEFELNSFQLADEDSIAVDSILDRYENMVELKGAVFRPGMYEVGNNINSVRTLLTQAEGVTEEAFTSHAVLHRMREDRTLEVIAVNVEGILAGTLPDVQLKKNDVLFIPTKQQFMKEQTVTIHGEVFSPGVFKYAANSSLESLILQAGGLKETASTVKVDVARRVRNPRATTSDTEIAQTFSFALKDGFVIDGEPGFTLMPFDEVYVRKSPGYHETQNVRVEGNVMFAGTYTLTKKNERLSDLIKKAGGVTDLAYLRGARLERTVTEEERMRNETTLRVLAMQKGGKDSIDVNKVDLGNVMWVGINLEKALQEPGGEEDIIVRDNDRIYVPEYNSTVKVSGDVMYPNTVPYVEGRSVSWYIDHAGGYGNTAKKTKKFIIYMNGEVSKAKGRTEVRPGAEIIVSSKPKGTGMKLTDWLSIGTSAAALATMIATITNLLK